jgi:flagellar basal body-associated protein FliL
MKILLTSLLLFFHTIGFSQLAASKIEKLKAEVAAEVEKNAALGQQINDMLFRNWVSKK